MQEIWHNIFFTGPSEGPILAEACADGSSPWFSGHFPEAPVLPAIAILSMVRDVISHDEARGIKIAAIRKVRFRLPVKPGEILKICVYPPDRDGDASYRFRVEMNGETVCTGIMAVETLQK